MRLWIHELHSKVGGIFNLLRYLILSLILGDVCEFGLGKIFRMSGSSSNCHFLSQRFVSIFSDAVGRKPPRHLHPGRAWASRVNGGARREHLVQWCHPLRPPLHRWTQLVGQRGPSTLGGNANGPTDSPTSDLEIKSWVVRTCEDREWGKTPK